MLYFQTLKFQAYYKESITDSADENFRVRLVDIYYFLEDDTIMVNEPKIEVKNLLAIILQLFSQLNYESQLDQES